MHVDSSHSGAWLTPAWPVVALITAGVLLGALLCGCSDGLAAARSLEEQGDLMGAVQAYDLILEKNPDNIGALSGLAVALLLMQEYDRALPVQERLVALDQEDVQMRVELGFNYLNHQKRAEDAVRVLGEATTLDPTAQHMTFLAQAQVASGDTRSAEATLRHAVDVDPGYGRSYSMLSGLLVDAGRVQDASAVLLLAEARGLQIEGAR